MGLFKPLWMSENYSKARKGLERIHDDATLCKSVCFVDVAEVV